MSVTSFLSTALKTEIKYLIEINMKLNQLTRSISLALITSAAASSTQAATIEVDDECSLIQAIQAANNDAVVGGCEAGSGADVIEIIEPDSTLELTAAFGPSQVPENPNAFTGLPSITSHVTIEGNGLTIKRNSMDKFRLMEVIGSNNSPQSASLHLKKTTLTGGDANVGYFTHDGGAVFVRRANLHLENTSIIKNQKALFVSSSENTVIEHSVIRDNTVSLNITASALEAVRSKVTMSHTSVVNNRYSQSIYNFSPSESGRRYGAVHLDGSNVNISNSTFSGNKGAIVGAISVSSGSTTRTPSQTSPMLGYQRGQVSDYRVTITNSTITGNTASLTGGISSATNSQYGSLTLAGNIISGNVATGSDQRGRDLLASSPSGLFLDNNNLFGEFGDDGVLGITLGTTDRVLQTSTDALLFPLTESNGQFVHPLKAGSVAIDAMPVDCAGPEVDLTTDQEGTPRAIDGDGDGVALCDLGAFEKSIDIVVNGNCSLNDAIISANTDTSVGTCQVGLGADVIQLPINSQQTLTEVSGDVDGFQFGLPNISSAIALEGNGSSITRASSAPDFGIVGVTEGGDLSLNNITLSQGAGEFAGVFSYAGNISLNNSTITQMHGVSLFSTNSAQFQIKNSTLSNNNTINILGNGSVQTDTVKIESSAFHNNTGLVGAAMGLRLNNYTNIQNSTISSNTSMGGSSFLIVGPAEINGVTVTQNTASEYSGGAYFSTQPFTDVLAPRKGVVIQNSIFSGNTLNQIPERRGISNDEIFVSNNGGAGVKSFNNIFGQNNVSGTGTITLDKDSIVPSTNTDEVIGPLQNNGGFTLSHAPLVNGVAVDTGQQNCLLNRDQANNIRPFDGDGDTDERCDIGAIELGSFNPDDLIFKDGFEG